MPPTHVNADSYSDARKAQQEALRLAREAQKRAAQELREAQRRAEQEARRAAQEAQRQAREAQRQAEQEAKRQAQEAQRQQREAQRQAEQEARRQAQEAQRQQREAQRQAEQEAKRQAQEAARQQQEAQRQAEQEAKRQAQEAARQQQEAQRQAEQEAKRQAQEAARQQQEAQRQAEQEAKRQVQEAARQQQEAQLQAEQEAKRQAQEAQRQQQEAQRQAEQEAQRQAEQEAKRQAQQAQQAQKQQQPQSPSQAGKAAGPSTVAIPAKAPAASDTTADRRTDADTRQRASESQGVAPTASSDVSKTQPSPIPSIATTPRVEDKRDVDPVRVQAPTVGNSLVKAKPSTNDDRTSAAKVTPTWVPKRESNADSSRSDRSVQGRDGKAKSGKKPSALIATIESPEDVERATALGLKAGPVTVLPSGQRVQRFEVPNNKSADQIARELTRQMPLTPFAPNHTYTIYRGDVGSGDDKSPAPRSSFATQLINWQPALSRCTKDVKIGIIDTSFDTTHPALKNVKASFGQFLDGEAPSRYDWHGTAVLSLLAGNPESGILGLMPDAQFFLAAAFSSDENGNASTDTARLLAALAWLDRLGVDYVNMSFSGPRDVLFEAAIKRMRQKGVVFVAAAGNQGPTAPPSYPAAYPDVIAVTAINSKGESYRQANRGTYIDVAAPGVDVLAALPGGTSGYRTGTSFAAPFVTAIVAARTAKGEVARGKPELLRDFSMKDLGPPGPDPIYGKGLVLAPQDCGSTGVVAKAPPSGSPPLQPASMQALPPLMGIGAAFAAD